MHACIIAAIIGVSSVGTLIRLRLGNSKPLLRDFAEKILQGRLLFIALHCHSLSISIDNRGHITLIPELMHE